MYFLHPKNTHKKSLYPESSSLKCLLLNKIILRYKDSIRSLVYNIRIVYVGSLKTFLLIYSTFFFIKRDTFLFFHAKAAFIIKKWDMFPYFDLLNVWDHELMTFRLNQNLIQIECFWIINSPIHFIESFLVLCDPFEWLKKWVLADYCEKSKIKISVFDVYENHQ